MKVSAKIFVKGTKPLLIHTFPIDALSSGKSRSGTSGKDEQEWKNTVLMNSERNLYILSSYIIAATKNGGKLIKVGKSSMMKKVESCLECLDDIILIDGLKVPEEDQITRSATDPVYIDVRSVVNPMTKGRNLRYRVAAKAGWTFTTKLMWDDSVISKETMKQCVENAGLYEGIGDGRRIGFGRFVLMSFDMQKD